MNPIGVPASYSLVELGRLPWNSSDKTNVLATLTVAECYGNDGWSELEWPSLEQKTPFSASVNSDFPGVLRVEGPILGAKTTSHARVAGTECLLVEANEGASTIVGEYLFYVRQSTLVLASMSAPAVELQELGGGLDLRLIWKNAVEVESAADTLLDEVFSQHNVEPWLLREAIAVVEAGQTHCTTSAVGLIARLHEEDTRLGRSVDDTCIGAAIRWLRQQDVQEIEASAQDSLQKLERELTVFDQALADDLPSAAQLGRRFVKHRDDLESVSWLLRRVGSGKYLATALLSFDEKTSVGHSRWLGIAAFSTDLRLSAVSWQSPDLWWSSLGV